MQRKKIATTQKKVFINNIIRLLTFFGNNMEEWQSGLMHMTMYFVIEVNASEGSNPFFLRKKNPTDRLGFLHSGS